MTEVPFSKGVISCAVKGGTGKTLTSIALAGALSRMGVNTGVLDIDTDSPNLGAMFGIYGGLEQDKERYFVPKLIDKIQVMSAGFMADGLYASYKRGTENRQIVRDMLLFSRWKDVQIMIADAGAGSGDQIRAFIEAVPKELIAGVVVTINPDTLDGLKRCEEIFSRLCIPILGVIENKKGTRTKAGGIAICSITKEPVNFYGADDEVKKYCTEKGLRYICAIPVMEGFYKGSGKFPYLPDDVQKPIDDFITFLLGVKA